MSPIRCEQDNTIEIIHISGILDDSALDQLSQTISMLRQQGSTMLLWLGSDLEKITAREINHILSPIRVFCGMGGKIALAEFNERDVKVIRKATWHKYLNVFKTKKEALLFLDPQSNRD